MPSKRSSQLTPVSRAVAHILTAYDLMLRQASCESPNVRQELADHIVETRDGFGDDSVLPDCEHDYSAEVLLRDCLASVDAVFGIYGWNPELTAQQVKFTSEALDFLLELSDRLRDEGYVDRHAAFLGFAIPDDRMTDELTQAMRSVVARYF